MSDGNPSGVNRAAVTLAVGVVAAIGALTWDTYTNGVFGTFDGSPRSIAYVLGCALIVFLVGSLMAAFMRGD